MNNSPMNTLTKKLAVLAVVGGVVATGSVAWALWPSTGTGSGNAKAASAVAVTVSAATGAADHYPGFANGDVFFTVTNTNPYPVTFTSMTPGTVTSSDPTNCPSANVTVAPATGLSLAVAAGASNAPGSVADVVSMDVNAPTGCQGVVFTIGLTLSGSQT
jgi:hypothetical protein